MPAHPEEDLQNALREADLQAEAAQRRDESVERSKAAMWRLVEVRKRQQEAASQIDQQMDAERQAREEIREALIAAGIAWLEEKWGYERTCPYCDALEWGVSTPLDSFLLEDGQISAHFEVTCGNCAHTVFIDAFKAGLLPDDGNVYDDDSPFEKDSP